MIRDGAPFLDEPGFGLIRRQEYLLTKKKLTSQNHFHFSAKMQDDYWSDEEEIDEEFTSEDNVIDTPDVSSKLQI